MKKIIAFLLLLSPLLLIFVSLTDYYTGYEIYRDISYAGEKDNVMDIYFPKEAYGRESNGCVLFIHGGSWSGGDKSEETHRCRLLASRGYISATMNYTLWNESNANEYNVFDVLDEIDTALMKIKAFALERGIIIDKAATSGYSAGAHLSMLYSFSRSDMAPMQIVFTSNMAGPSDISPRLWGEDMARAIGNRLTGTDITEDMINAEKTKNLLSLISPVSYICENTPPTVIMHGGKDSVVPVGNAESLVEKFKEYSVPYDYVYLKDSDHSLGQNPYKHFTYYKILLEYCEKYF